jgi:cystathionine beta-lyase/cystathionine gamma-synthase
MNIRETRARRASIEGQIIDSCHTVEPVGHGRCDRASRGPSTVAVHGGDGALASGGLTTPLHLSTAFAEGTPGGFAYSRLANPTVESVAARIAALEGVEAAVLTASGTAALLAAVLGVVPAGGLLVASSALCDDTEILLGESLPGFGRRVQRVAPDDHAGWERALAGDACAALAEVVSNPELRVADVARIAAAAHAHGALLLVDSTLVTPIVCRPAEHGADLVIHSATKALNGHSDVTAGAVAGSVALVERVRSETLRLGACLDPHAAYLLERGLKTLALRVDRQCATAAALATWLAGRDDIAAVRYPLLPDHPDAPLATVQLHGGGSVLTIALEGGCERAAAFLDGLRLIRQAPTLGGVETLATVPHAPGPPGRVRLSIGIEDAADLVGDLTDALDASRPATPARRAFSGARAR